MKNGGRNKGSDRKNKWENEDTEKSKIRETNRVVRRGRDKNREKGNRQDTVRGKWMIKWDE